MIIEENQLHYNDKITYTKLEELHTKYAPKSEIDVFAEKVLDINYKCFRNIKYSKTLSCTHILLSEKLPDEQEIEEIKIKVIKENKLHRKDIIKYEQIQELHLKYGGIMPDYMFAEKILNIDSRIFFKMKLNQKSNTQILLKTKMSQQDIDKLKSKIVRNNNLYKGKGITIEEFERLYNSYEHILSQIEFARQILGVNRQSLTRLKAGISETVQAFTKVNGEEKRKTRINFNDDEVLRLKMYLIKDLSEEEIATKLGVTLKVLKINMEALFRYERLSIDEINYEKAVYLYEKGLTIEEIKEKTKLDSQKLNDIVKKINQQKKERKNKIRKIRKHNNLKNKVNVIVESSTHEDKKIATVRRFISGCKEQFEDGDFKIEDLDFLEKCIAFVGGKEDEIVLFVKMCISFKEYKRASKFILESIRRSKIEGEKRKKLVTLQGEIKYAIKLEEALELIKNGEDNVQSIVKNLGLLEVDVIRLKNSVKRSGEKIHDDGIELTNF